MKRFASTLCALILGATGIAQEQEHINFASDPPTPIITQRIDSLDHYSLSVSKEDIRYGFVYINSVKTTKRQPKKKEKYTEYNPYYEPPPTPKLSKENNHLQNSIDQNITSIYFNVDDATLSKQDSLDIQMIAEYYRKLFSKEISKENFHLLVEARADQTHTSEYNMQLSKDRGTKVVKLLKKYLPSAYIEHIAFGNASPLCKGTQEHELALNRVVRIIPNKKALEQALGTIPGTKIIDNSESMNHCSLSGYVPWQVILQHDFSKDKVYLFSKKTTTKQNGKQILVAWPNNHELIEYYPNGLTPLKEIMLYTVATAPIGETLCFVTDGKASPSSVEYTDIIKVAKKRKIKISFIGVGVYGDEREILEYISLTTRGQTYFAMPVQKTHPKKPSSLKTSIAGQTNALSTPNIAFQKPVAVER